MRYFLSLYWGKPPVLQSTAENYKQEEIIICCTKQEKSERIENPTSAEENKVHYANAVGCLMYSVVCTSPVLAQAISIVPKYIANPGKQHCSIVPW